MNIQRQGQSGFRSRIGFVGLCTAVAALTAAFVIASPSAEASSAKPVSAPQITMTLEPTTPTGQLRVYPVQNGVSYWTPELPIYRGDTVRLAVFVASGANDLQELKVRIDNQLVDDVTKAPWTIRLSSDKLGNGLHMIEAWAQVSGPKTQFADKAMTFFVNTMPIQTAMATPTANEKIAGKSQVLVNGKIVEIPLDTSNAAAPELPAVLANATLDPKVFVSIALKDRATDSPVAATEQDPLMNPAVATIVPASGSDVRQFAYAIVHNGITSVPSNQLYSVASTMIRLQPRTSTTPGLLPGISMLWVWPVTSTGSYGTPVSLPVVIGAAAGG